MVLDGIPILGAIEQFKYFSFKKGSKKRITKYNILNMLKRTSRMFEWKKLPDTIPQRNLELIIQTWGECGIFEFDGDYYCAWGTLGGEPNFNYMPSKFIVANPHLGKDGNFSKEFDIYGENKNVVIIPNDTLYQGILPILNFHSELLTEIQLTKRLIIVNARAQNVFTAPDNNAKKDVDDLLNDLDEGKIASILDKNFMKSIGSLPFGESRSANIITQVIEMEQYQRANLYNDLGLQANYNMKRETLTSSENLLNIDALLPLCDDMLEMRQNACKELKSLFGLDIEVDFSSAWKMLRENLKLDQKVKEASIKKENENEVHLNGPMEDKNDGTTDTGLADGANDNGSEEKTDKVSETESSESRVQEHDTETTYKDAVETVAPIIEATKEVIEKLVEEEDDGKEKTD